MRPPERRYRRRARVPLPGLGESVGSVAVRDDVGRRVAEAGQVSGEGVGLLHREGSEAQAAARSEIEDRVDFTS